MGLHGTGWCQWPQREGLLKWVGFGVEGVEGKGSTALKSRPSGADVEKDEVSYPSLGRTCVRPLSPGQQPHHHGSAPAPVPCLHSTARVVGNAPEGEWGCLHPEDCLSLCGDH